MLARNQNAIGAIDVEKQFFYCRLDTKSKMVCLGNGIYTIALEYTSADHNSYTEIYCDKYTYFVHLKFFCYFAMIDSRLSLCLPCASQLVPAKLNWSLFK